MKLISKIIDVMYQYGVSAKCEDDDNGPFIERWISQ